MRSLTATASLLGFTGLVWAQTEMTEQSEAALTDPTQECTVYGWGPVAAAVAAGQFPTVWVPVSALVESDTEGQALFKSINSSIPNIAPKGTLGVIDANISAAYNEAADADCWWSATTCIQPKHAGVNADVAFVPEPNTLGYGFDDGPNCTHNAFYNFLQSKNQKATLFYIGSNVLDWPLQAQRAVADGHEICVHTWSHREMTAFNNEQAFGELWYSRQAIKLVTGYTPTCWRPPLGDVDDRIRYIAQQLNLTNILWRYNSNDWQVSANLSTPAQVQVNYDMLITAANSGTFNSQGAIILTHELNNYTMQTAMDNYANLTTAFKHVVPVLVGLNRTQVYAETNYTGPTFEQYISGTTTSTNSTTGGGSGTSSGSGSTTTTGTGASVAVRPAVVILALSLLGVAGCLV